MYAKDLNAPKHQFLIKISEGAGIKDLSDAKGLIEYSACMYGVYNNVNEYNPTSIRKYLIVSGDMIADIMTNKNFSAIIK